MRARRSEAAAKPAPTASAELEAAAELGRNDYAFLRRRPSSRRKGSGLVRIVDLFAGCGGLSLGVEEAVRASGHSPLIVLAAETDSTIREVYRANFPDANVDPVGDVVKLLDGRVGARITSAERKTRTTAGRVDLAMGGPPCQGHSNLNNHTRRDDERNALYLRMVRAAEVLEPKSFCIENVPGVRGDRGRVVDVAVADGEVGALVPDSRAVVARLVQARALAGSSRSV